MTRRFVFAGTIQVISNVYGLTRHARAAKRRACGSPPRRLNILQHIAPMHIVRYYMHRRRHHRALLTPTPPLYVLRLSSFFLKPNVSHCWVKASLHFSHYFRTFGLHLTSPLKSSPGFPAISDEVCRVSFFKL